MTNGSKSGPRQGQYSKERMDKYADGWDKMRGAKPPANKGISIELVVMFTVCVISIMAAIGVGMFVVKMLMGAFPLVN